MTQTVNIKEVHNDFILLDKISKTYQVDDVKTEILVKTSLSIQKGEFVIIMGPSGCGKTTLLNIIGALDSEYDGSSSVDGQKLTGLSNEDLAKYRRHKVGFIFQFFNLLPTLTVEENVTAGIELLSLSRKEIEERTKNALSKVGLHQKAGKFPSHLSGGEQQRASIARALAKQPKLLLADEPTGNLDEANGYNIMDMLKQINEEFGMTIVLVTHNPSYLRYADRVVEIHNKQIVVKDDREHIKSISLSNKHILVKDDPEHLKSISLS